MSARLLLLLACCLGGARGGCVQERLDATCDTLHPGMVARFSRGLWGCFASLTAKNARQCVDDQGALEVCAARHPLPYYFPDSHDHLIAAEILEAQAYCEEALRPRPPPPTPPGSPPPPPRLEPPTVELAPAERTTADGARLVLATSRFRLQSVLDPTSARAERNGRVEWQYQWTAEMTKSHGGGPLRAPDLRDPRVSPGGDAHANLVLNSGALLAGAEYAFHLEVGAPGGPRGAFSRASARARVNVPPAGGALSVSPKAGTELATSFELAAPRWADEQLPLTYEFA